MVTFTSFFSLKRFLTSIIMLFYIFIIFSKSWTFHHYMLWRITYYFFFIKVLNELHICLKIYQLNIIKITKKDYWKKLVQDIKVFLKKKKKKIQTSFRRWKTKAGWVYKKNIIKWEKIRQYDYRKLFLTNYFQLENLVFFLSYGLVLVMGLFWYFFNLRFVLKCLFVRINQQSPCIVINFFRVHFLLIFRAWGWKVAQVVLIFTTILD